jgi:uncharacterized membrane protein YdjX (TVP38/TMEM64 family)
MAIAICISSHGNIDRHMKRTILVSCVAFLLVAGVIIAISLLGPAQAITHYVDQLHSRNADIIVRYYPLLLLFYFVAYALFVAFCLPVAALMAVIGGLMFGMAGFVVALFSVTIGSIAPFLISRRFAAPMLARVGSDIVGRMRRGFDRNQFQYLVLMRLVPWAPFTVTTIVAGALGTGLTKFLIGTALGFAPTGLALNAIGHGLGRLADLRSMSAVQLYRDPDFLIALGGVSAITLLSLSRRIPLVARLLG